MSRIGKKPVPVPNGVTVTIDGQSIKVKGPKGELAFDATDDVSIEMSDEGVTVKPRNDSKQARSAWGMSRTMIANLMTGVEKGFEKRLEITGVNPLLQVAQELEGVFINGDDDDGVLWGLGPAQPEARVHRPGFQAGAPGGPGKL